jgi:hypothetical protein
VETHYRPTNSITLSTTINSSDYRWQGTQNLCDQRSIIDIADPNP